MINRVVSVSYLKKGETLVSPFCLMYLLFACLDFIFKQKNPPTKNKMSEYIEYQIYRTCKGQVTFMFVV